MGTRTFTDTFTSCLDQLAELEVRFNRFTALSVDYQLLWKQDEEFEAYKTDVHQVKALFDQLTKSQQQQQGTSGLSCIHNSPPLTENLNH